MYVVQETAPDVFVELAPHKSFTVGDTLHPWQVVELWSDADLAAIGVYRVPYIETPAGKGLTSYSFARIGGEVVAVPVFADLPKSNPSARQLRLALNALGLRQAVEDFVAAAGQNVKDSWEYSTEFERNHPFVTAAKEALQKTDAELDALFDLARTL